MWLDIGCYCAYVISWIKSFSIEIERFQEVNKVSPSNFRAFNRPDIRTQHPCTIFFFSSSEEYHLWSIHCHYLIELQHFVNCVLLFLSQCKDQRPRWFDWVTFRVYICIKSKEKKHDSFDFVKIRRVYLIRLSSVLDFYLLKCTLVVSRKLLLLQ